MLAKRRVLVVVTGGVAAFKSALVVRELQRRGADVRVAMTTGATKFIAPLTFTGLTGRPPDVDLWDDRYRGEIHVDLAAWAELIVVVPATATSLAKMALGVADDLVHATILGARGRVVVAPAMHTSMWEHAATTTNIATLRGRGVVVVGPVAGPLASGEIGIGRLAEPLDIVAAAESVLAPADLADKHIVVTAGPTIEDIDPVRFLGNRSSGKMGYAIAERARARGARVTLITGPTALTPPSNVETVHVRSTEEMQRALASNFNVDAIIMAAAVADYRPAVKLDAKIKRSTDKLSIDLVRNPDLLAELGRRRKGARPALVGFALETSKVVEHARGKLERKNVDLIVANLAGDSLGKETNAVQLVDREKVVRVPARSKELVAEAILDRTVALLAPARRSTAKRQRRPRR